MKNTMLAINAGSSTVKFQLFNMQNETCLAKGMVDKLGKPDASFELKTSTDKLVLSNIKQKSPGEIFDLIISKLDQYTDDLGNLAGVSHRVAHGGEHFQQSTLIDDNVLKAIEDNNVLAPLHNPTNVAFIKAAKNALSNVYQVAVFDTAFHQSIAPEHYVYPIPYQFYENDSIRRYGFHGTSHKFVYKSYLESIGSPEENTKIICCHLGSGSSICAIKDGKSVNTSMGFTPLAGLMMGTRCGDIDPAIPSYIATKHDKTLQEVEDILTKESGLLGVSQISNDCRAIENAAKKGDSKAILALDIFCERIRHFIGAYWLQMDGCDAIVFTGGIGENSRLIRQKVCTGLESIGITIDEARNQNNEPQFNGDDSKVILAIVNTNEELMMAREGLEVIDAC
ncbi:acetate/propionate family kinase [Vibrio maritimus]|uniref:acetate/propionate family kinase n=1 Tax=Vibrio maritimus TaxID=990268 RepID=UPI003736E163